jgi:hypothetical protein
LQREPSKNTEISRSSTIKIWTAIKIMTKSLFIYEIDETSWRKDQVTLFHRIPKNELDQIRKWLTSNEQNADFHMWFTAKRSSNLMTDVQRRQSAQNSCLRSLVMGGNIEPSEDFKNSLYESLWDVLIEKPW